MASPQPTLTDPDKVGLLIQYRQKMDKLNDTQLYKHSNSSLRLLSTEQLKNVLFVGLNSIKNELSYHQLFEMKSSINQMIEEAKKLKEKSESKSKESVMNKQLIIPIIPKNASLTKVIPFDIISNNICRFLKMSSITNLAKVDRKLAIICHTPTSINNLMHRYDPYKYAETENDIMIDGYYHRLHLWTFSLSNMHRLKNIETLSIDLECINDFANMEILNSFGNVKHLSFFDMKDGASYYDGNSNVVKPMPLLETISFTNMNILPNILYLLQQYKYSQIISQLKSIAFIDCDFSQTLQDLGYEDGDGIFLEYGDMVNFILQSQPNNLHVLKLENSFFYATEHKECKDANDEFNNVGRIKESLANLKGFVYGKPKNDSHRNIFCKLAGHILSNVISFKHLESLHIHSNSYQIETYLNTNALTKITELCMSVLMNQNINARSPLHSLNRLVPNLEKLCLVIYISDDDKNHTSKFEKIIKSLLKCETKLKLFQLVLVLKDDRNTNKTFCETKINILTDLAKKLVKVWNYIQNYYTDSCKNPLLFQLHIKSSHSRLKPECCTCDLALQPFADIIQNMVVNYLVAYPIGKIQFKYSWNADEHDVIGNKLSHVMRRLHRLFAVSVKDGGSLKHLSDGSGNTCYSDMDFRQYAISITQKNIDQCIEYDNKWNVDCRYCCNTPWV